MVLFWRTISRIVILSVAMLLGACEKEDRHPVPFMDVNFRINLEFQYIELNSIGGHVNVYGGYGGIVIYRFAVDEFMAFDRACTYHPNDPQARVVVDDPPIATCKVCNSSFLLIDGSVIQGPARYPLRQYNTYYSDPYLQVSSY